MKKSLSYCSAFVLSLIVQDTCAQSEAASFSMGKTYLRCHADKESGDWSCRQFASDTNEEIERSQMQGAASPYDFVPADMLTDEQRQQLGPGCTGMYIDPLAGETVPETPESSPLVIEADDSVMTGTATASLEGNVQVSHGPRSVRADKMTYDRQEERASLEGGVTIRNPGLLIRGERASMSTTQNEASFEEAIFILHNRHIRGKAESIEQTGENSVILTGGSITGCEPGSNAWQLSGSEIRLDNKNNQGVGKHITLRVGSIPVLYIPWIAFPLGDERQSGFLFPSVSSSDNGGLDVAVPYYFNLAPNYDATLTPRFISGRGAMLEAEGRHMNRHFYTEASIGILPDDGGGADPDEDELIAAGIFTEEELRPHIGENRWLTHLNQRGGTRSGRGWFTSIDYTKVSDQEYFRDLGSEGFNEQNRTFLNQRAEAGYLFEHWTISAVAQNRQVLLYDLDTPYRKAPQLSANGYYQQGPLSYSLQHEFTRFDHPEGQWRNGDRVITGNRLTTDHRISLPFRGTWGLFEPEIGYKTLSYQLDPSILRPGADHAPTLGAGQFSLDASLVFEHPAGNILQTIEPRVFYLYREYEEHDALYDVTADGQDINFDTSVRTFSYSQLFRDSRFGGKDRLDDANQTTVGVTTRWINNESGRELFSASVGQVFHRDDRQVGLNGAETETTQTSELAGEIRAMLGPLAEVYVNAIFDTSGDEFTRSSSGIFFHSSDYRSIANLTYTFVRDYRQTSMAAGTTDATDIDQVDFSFVRPVNEQWSLMGRYNYDFTEDQELEAFLGFEYNDCCYRLRLLARKWLDSNIAALNGSADLDHDQGLFFEVQFKGLGGSGAKVSDILKDSIRGYEERELRNY